MRSHNCIIAKVKLLLALCLPGVVVFGQPLSVYSELARINTSGEVTAPETPREILSPMIVRNGFTSFQVVVQAPADKKWWLLVGQNPEDSFKMTMYAESGEDLERVELPIESQGTRVFWMDVWADGNALVQRVKLEPELHIDDDWVIYPIEGRVTAARVPDRSSDLAPLCPLAASSPTTPAATLRRRNAAQDTTMAGELPKVEFQRLLGFCDAGSPSVWTEGYLRIRDSLLRLR